MEKKPPTAAAAAPPVGVCERLFNALQIHPAFNNIRRLTNRQTGSPAAAQDQGSFPVPTAPPMATVPQPGPPPTTTPIRLNAPVLVPVKSALGPDNKVQGSVPPAPGKDKAGSKPPPARRDTSSVVKAAPDATPPQATVVEEPNGTGGQPQGGKPKKNINDKMEAYINRTRNRMRPPSHLGRTTTTAK